MKLSQSSSFDVKDLSEILRKAKAEALEPLLTAMVSAISEQQTALRGKLTVAENLSAIEKDVTLKHGIDQVISWLWAQPLWSTIAFAGFALAILGIAVEKS